MKWLHRCYLAGTVVNHAVAVILHNEAPPGSTVIACLGGPDVTVVRIEHHQVVVTLHEKAVGFLALTLSVAGPQRYCAGVHDEVSVILHDHAVQAVGAYERSLFHQRFAVGQWCLREEVGRAKITLVGANGRKPGAGGFEGLAGSRASVLDSVVLLRYTILLLLDFLLHADWVRALLEARSTRASKSKAATATLPSSRCLAGRENQRTYLELISAVHQFALGHV